MKTTQLFSENMLRSQITVGGADDIQFHLGKYRVSVRYTDERHARLIVVVFQLDFSGALPIARFALPAKKSYLCSDQEYFVRLVCDNGKNRRHEVAVLSDAGVIFISGIWEIEHRLMSPAAEEFAWGVDRNTERWNVKF